MKSFLFSVAVAMLMAPIVQANTAPAYLPTDATTYYYGCNDKTFALNSGDTVKVRLEFAVYDGTQADDMREWTNYQGDATGFVYAYQIFCDDTNTAALASFSLTGINASGISSVTNDISQAASLTTSNSEVFNSYGIEPQDSYFNDAVTEATWEFENGMMIHGESSWFLFLYSDADWVKGDFTIAEAAADDDISVPDGDGNSNIPEPATLLLLGIGALVSLKRK